MIEIEKSKASYENSNNTEYNAVGNRIKQCRQQLCGMQEQIRALGQSKTMVAVEKDMKTQLEKWLGVEKSIMKKK